MKVDIETFDLSQLPQSEDDFFEFKSSLISVKPADLSKKISCAVSGFGNSGGGYFIVGVDGDGNADGGIPLKVGKQDIRDWVDNVVNQVTPTPKYEIRLMSAANGRGYTKADSTVLVIAIHESYSGPHMAPDNCYYIRAGAHTTKANHFILDALWSKRHFSKPRLTHLFRIKTSSSEVIQLGILSLTDAPAVNVKISLLPLPKLLQATDYFPLQISVIDQNNPFFFDVAFHAQGRTYFEQDTQLEVEYLDLAGNQYIYKTKVDFVGQVPPLKFQNDAEKALKLFKSIDDSLSKIKKTLEARNTSDGHISRPRLMLPQPTEATFKEVEKLLPELLEEMRQDLHKYPFARELVIKFRNSAYNKHFLNDFVLDYDVETHPFLRNKLRILENYALIYEITSSNIPRFAITEELVKYLQRKP